MRVAIGTLGCKVNQAETELLARQFAEAGYELVSSADNADIYILNTCTVTHIADSKSRHLLRLAHRHNPGALIVATGCYAERAEEELSQVEGVSLVVGNEEKPKLWQLVDESGYVGGPVCSQGRLLGKPNNGFRTRSFIKIQDGCSNFCTYCIVPLVRGKEKSLSVDHIISEIKSRVASGYKEVVLTGIKVGSYDYDGVSLAGLLECILKETAVTRLRLSSLQPQEISPQLLHLWQNPRLCPHFHLSLQSGSGTVLKRMKRRYSVRDYQRAVSLIRTAVPEVAITTDVIVGFPGETEAEFAASYGLCQRMGFTRIHVFIYSPRAGTEAVQMPNTVGSHIKRERSEKMLALAEESTRKFGEQFLGKTVQVLWERQDGGDWSGHTNNYLRVYTKSSADLTNQLLPAKLVSMSRDGVCGEVDGG